MTARNVRVSVVLAVIVEIDVVQKNTIQPTRLVRTNIACVDLRFDDSVPSDTANPFVTNATPRVNRRNRKCLGSRGDVYRSQ